ncbi:cytochrome P450 family protein [Ceratobasidium sp. AG-Ba]|nr:cytochrome P450 family protein [Ceratobasidium sp. AG-Ba]
MDTDEEINIGGEGMSFFASEFSGGATPENEAAIEAALRALIKLCATDVTPRHHVTDSEHVDEVQDLIHQGLEKRIDQVRHWVTVNVARFPSANQDVRNLFNKINSSALAMRAVVRICSITCTNCQLNCLRPHRHTEDLHDCGTNHQCVFSCAIAEEHTTLEPCGLPAGHSGIHIRQATMEIIFVRHDLIYAEIAAIFETLVGVVHITVLEYATNLGTNRTLNMHATILAPAL